MRLVVWAMVLADDVAAGVAERQPEAERLNGAARAEALVNELRAEIRLAGGDSARADEAMRGVRVATSRHQEHGGQDGRRGRVDQCRRRDHTLGEGAYRIAYHGGGGGE